MYAQFCNPTTGDCTPISGWSLANAYLPQLALSDAQFITALRIISTIQFLTTYLSVHSRGASVLRAPETVDDQAFQIPLPDAQSMTKVSTWFAISMAKLQQKTVQYATGPAYIPAGTDLVGPFNEQ